MATQAPVHYITNAAAYFLIVKSELDLLKLEGCVIHESLSDLRDHAVKTSGYDREYLEELDIEIVIENGEYYDGMSRHYDVDLPLEKFISEFML